MTTYITYNDRQACQAGGLTKSLERIIQPPTSQAKILLVIFLSQVEPHNGATTDCVGDCVVRELVLHVLRDGENTIAPTDNYSMTARPPRRSRTPRRLPAHDPETRRRRRWRRRGPSRTRRSSWQVCPTHCRIVDSDGGHMDPGGPKTGHLQFVNWGGPIRLT